MTNLVVTTRAPGKLIISGEHAVVYGAPAVAIAVERYLTVILQANSETNNIIFYFSAQRVEKRLDELQKLKERVKTTGILQDSYELTQYLFIELIDKFGVDITTGMELRIHSDIPLGCGMGSSAALIISMLHAVVKFFKVPFELANYLEYGRELENIQHGSSSGLDISLATYGGCQLFQHGKIAFKAISQLPLSIVNTGRPQTSTRECVQLVKNLLEANTRLLAEFTEVTARVVTALASGNIELLKSAVTENQRLLQQLGVVPQRVQEFITALAQVGAAAKICGAGACSGDRAGVVLIITEHDISAVAAQYGYSLEAITISSGGVNVI